MKTWTVFIAVLVVLQVSAPYRLDIRPEQFELGVDVNGPIEAQIFLCWRNAYRALLMRLLDVCLCASASVHYTAEVDKCVDFL